MIKLADLRENPKNARAISDEHFAALRKSVATRPWMFPIRPIVARRTDGVVLGGNMRLRALLANGVTEVPDDWVRWVDLDDRQCEEMHVVDNESFGDWIVEDLLALYGRDRLLEMDVDVDELLKGVDVETDAGGTDGKTDADDVPETSEEPKSVRGVVYACGRHRLMCGDATCADDFARLMGGMKADMCFTDPPYNVSIGDRNKVLNIVEKKHGQKNLGGRIETNIAGDSGMTDEECGEKLWKPAFENMQRVAADYCAIYVTMPQGGTHMMMMMMMMRSSWQVKHELMWLKSQPTFSMGRLDYDYKHEPICYGWNKSHRFFGKGKFTKSVWEFDKPKQSKLHPTMKPVALIENALLNSSQSGEIVLDAFGGSGTTMIACEQTGRCARLMEIDPHYCDVIRRRWAEFVHGEGCDWEALTPEAAT